MKLAERRTGMEDRGKEFWQEQREANRKELLRFSLRWGIVLAAISAIFGWMLWRSSSAVDFAASRVEANTPARYKITGTVRDAVTSKTVPWPVIADSPEGSPPHFHTTGKHDGTFELWTIAEPHNVVISALGYRSVTVRVGKAWYLWMPSGEEKFEIRLDPE
jgi:hypothetical protein